MKICKVFQTEMGRLTQLTDINEYQAIDARGGGNIKNIIMKTSGK